MAYSLEEKETHFMYDAVAEKWFVESNIPRDIRRLQKALLPDSVKTEVEDDRIIYISGFIDLDAYRIGLTKRAARPEMTEEERQAAAERFKANLARGKAEKAQNGDD